MRLRFIRVVIVAVLLCTALIGLGARVAAASPNCGTRVELQLWSGVNQSGRMLGYMCGTSSFGGATANTYNYDEDFGDLARSFRGSDNDDTVSWRLYNPTGSTWCFILYQHRNAFISTTGWELQYSLAPTSSWWGPSGGAIPSSYWDEASSAQIYRKSTYEGSGSCNGVAHDTTPV